MKSLNAAMVNWVLALMALSLFKCEVASDCGSPLMWNELGGRSCKDIKDKYSCDKDGLYTLTTVNGAVYQTYCDMTTAGGGWTLVASVQENNMLGKCTTGDRWSSQHGTNKLFPKGDNNWANKVTFGNAEGSTSDDYKNPGYYDLNAKDVSVWHVPNHSPREQWTNSSFLQYHTETNFLSSSGGNLYQLFKRYPVICNTGSCPADHGPVSKVMYDKGNKDLNQIQYGLAIRNQYVPGFISFRVYNSHRGVHAICSGVKPIGCETEHFCIGGCGYFPANNKKICGDFASFDWSGYGTNNRWSATKQITEAAVLIFLR